jgi:hypothetical protein
MKNFRILAGAGILVILFGKIFFPGDWGTLDDYAFFVIMIALVITIFSQKKDA